MNEAPGTAMARSISSLPEQVTALSNADRDRFGRLFSLTRSVGHTTPPEEMTAWIERAFGDLDAVKHQTIIKIHNRWTLEGTLFNDLRARRPIQGRLADARLDLGGDGTDPFCAPLAGTPADTFGRITGQHSITASNVAKYDGLHSVVILNEHNPLSWSEESVVDALTTAERWLRRAHQAQPSAVYPFVMWNCLPRSGASILHGHMQTALSEECAYTRVESWRRAAQAYREQHSAPYFADFFDAHSALDLGGEFGKVRWLAHLTPIREKEVLLLADRLDAELFGVIHRVLRSWVDGLGVQAFNLALYLPPMVPVAEDWSAFPVVVRFVDRGDPASATSDVGAMELFAQPVVSSDPWRVASVLRTKLQSGANERETPETPSDPG